ncbi:MULTISPECIES: radical SAM protein [Streptomyces]|uniref:Radical SAM protein n=1 Tax=Streptomyces lycii TaxID=2654337 RepID=A0ABQ7FDS0_9ACTN|nr:radical SAM protein [Streptomyces lycii]KAF4407199.1 radical SAM protein [Streptomyces lycii]
MTEADRPLGTPRVADNLDLVGKLYQRSVYPAVREVADGRRLKWPLVVDLDPTTLCDLACPECISSGVLHSGQFSGDRILELAHEMADSGVRAVILIGGGEPLMHRSIGKVIEVLHGAGIRLGLVTNGTLIGRYLDELADMVSWVRVSMDAATRETYDIFRPSRRKTSVFPQIVGDMRRLAERKAGRLGYSFLLMQRRDAEGRVTESNYHEVQLAGELAKDIGCDYFELKAMLDADHFTVNQAAEDTELVEKQWKALGTIEDESFRLLRSSNWMAVRSGSDPVQHKDYAACPVAELRTTVTPNGVYICPYHRGNPKGKLGDLTGTTFAEMWENADTTAVDPRSDCRFHCARHPTNVEIGALRERTGPVELTDDFDPFI